MKEAATQTAGRAPDAELLSMVWLISSCKLPATAEVNVH